jgi:NAD(P)-dependent dehydrogenase (short-subunit alcohol dehydrogenase family)
MKTILITGGTRGIGRATALLCASKGWSVALNYLRDASAADAAALEVRAAGGRVVTLQGDVAAASRLGAPFEYVDYAGSKAAIDTLTIGLAKELGPQGVRVNAVRPALIETEIHASGGQPDRAHRLGSATPLGRAGRPEEVAAAIVWLLDDGASYTTGAILDVAGGR